VQEALVAAAMQWPDGGVPGNPYGWLVTVASRRLADRARSEAARRSREEAVSASGSEEELPQEEDDVLTLLYMCCHPALTPASQVALTLRAVGA
jgi:predicted RNA polymerase sigma factor